MPADCPPVPPGDFSQLPVEIETADFSLVDVSALLPRRSDKHYGKRNPRHIGEIWCHQTQGGTTKHAGFEGVKNTAEFMVADDDPLTADVEGRCWPGMAYTFYVPFTPDVGPFGKPVIYRCQPDDALSYHTKTRNAVGVGVAFQGLFKSKSAPDGGKPSDWQRAVFRPLVKYLQQRYTLLPIDVFAHSDTGLKPDCPGYEIEDWIGRYRDEFVGREALKLDSWVNRQRALAECGFLRASDIDGIYGPKTRMCIERIQDAHRLPVDGLWNRLTDTFIRRLLATRLADEKEHA